MAHGYGSLEPWLLSTALALAAATSVALALVVQARSEARQRAARHEPTRSVPAEAAEAAALQNLVEEHRAVLRAHAGRREDAD